MAFVVIYIIKFNNFYINLYQLYTIFDVFKVWYNTLETKLTCLALEQEAHLMASNKDSGKLSPEQKNRRISPLKKQNRKRTLKLFLITLLSVFIFSSVAVGAYTINAALKTPEWAPHILADQKESSIVYDKDGEPIAQLHASENRLLVDFKDIPDLVKKTFIAVEDKRFEDHYGADPIRILKAAWNNFKAGKVVEGGSTITIQLAKNAFIENPTAKKLDRKIQELVLAIQIERAYTKDEILSFYLNRIFFGESSFGIRTASKTYFGKDLPDLNPAEVALLAGLPQAPSAYDPYQNPENAKKRRNLVLSVMRDNGIISPAEFDEYKEEPFTFVEQVQANQAEVEVEISTRNKKHPYFVDYVISELEEKHGLSPEQIFNGGLHIYTTVDSKIQTAAEEAFANPANFPKSIDDIPVQGAMTVLEVETGAITAMVGGREYTARGLNRAAQSKRQPGSAIKPLLVYAPALERGGYFPGTVFDDMPVEYSDGRGGVWAPVNYDTQTAGWSGLITMREAVRNSVNVYAVKLMDSIGVDYAWQFGKNNLELPLEEEDKVLSLALGTAHFSTLDMASAYSTFPNNGIKTDPYSVTKVVSSEGDTLLETVPTNKRVMKETTAYVMNDLLRTVVTSGTGTRARIGNWYIGGKTGTTSLDREKYGRKTGNPDAWFAGYSPKYTGVVWMGYDSDPDKKHYMYQVYGGNLPATIWKNVMTVAHQDLPVQSSIPRPQGMTSVKYDRKSGLLPSSLTPSQFVSAEICASGSVPTSVSDVWIEVNVDPLNPDLLAPEGSPYTTRVVLNLPDRPEDEQWPADEAPFKMPTEYSDGNGKVGDGNPIGYSNAPPEGDADLPQVSLGDLTFSKGNTKVQIQIIDSYDSEKYLPLLYIKRPGFPYIETFIPEDGKVSSIEYRLTPSGPATPGEYTFWAALMDIDTFAYGPPSNSVTLNVFND